MTHSVIRRRRRKLVAPALAAATIGLLPIGLLVAPSNAVDTTATASMTATAAAEQQLAAFSLPANTADATAALSATPWVTTGAKDQNGDPVALSDARAANFVGNAYFKADGTFTMYNLDDSPKMHGDWEMRTVDGQLVRWIAAKNGAGDVLFERVVPIIDLDAKFFTYRVVDADDSSKWVDIIHEPTLHLEPGTEQAAIDAATAALAATPWETTGARDLTGANVALSDPRAANFVGNAYFHADGTFDMFNLGTDSPKMHGTWDMRVIDGVLNRHIDALLPNGTPVTRDVQVVQADASYFTYRVPGQNGAYTDIIHTPTDYSVTETAAAELAAKPWVTTGAKDQNGDDVALSDARAANFVGNAYFKADGTFTMFNLDDSPKMHGDWDMRVVDGRVARWIAAKNGAGNVLFERVVPIVDLDAGVFTYRVVDADDSSKWVDIIHTPIPAFGSVVVNGPTSVTLPKSGSKSARLSVAFNGPAIAGSTSYTSRTANALVSKNRKVRSSYVRTAPTIAPLDVKQLIAPASAKAYGMSVTPGTTPGVYRATPTITKTQRGTEQVASGSRLVTVKANTGYSKARTTVVREGSRKYGRAFKVRVNAPYYQVGAKVTAYVKLPGSKTYKRITSGYLKSGSRTFSKAGLKISSKYNTRNARFIFKVGSAPYAGGYQTAVQRFRR